MNTVNLIGRLTKDGEIKFPGSTAIYKNSIAVTRKFKREESDFINLVAFGKTAELMGDHLNKGDQVGIEGHIQTGSYEKDGKKIYTFDVVVDNITFIGGGKKQESQQQTKTVNDPFAKDGTPIDLTDDDLPF